MSFLKDHDQPMYAMLDTASRGNETQEGVTLLCANQFITEQIRKALPEVRKKAQVFFRKDLEILVEMKEDPQPAARKPRPSEIRTNALKSAMVKEVLSEFNGVVKDVKPVE